MDVIHDILQNMWRYLSTVSIWDVFDVLVATVVIYKLISMLRRSNALRVFRGILLLLVVLWVSDQIGLHVISYVLANTMQIGLFALVVVFQPELRRLLEQVGANRFKQMIWREPVSHMDQVIRQTTAACSSLSWRREGALIVFQRKTLLTDITRTGTLIHADISAELLMNIFYPNTPLHDGAVIVQEGRLAAAGCMLPLTANINVDRELGMRHRAGLGISEVSDAVVVIVSEESGSISVAMAGAFKRHLTPETLESLLRAELIQPEDENKKSNLLRTLFRGGKPDKKQAPGGGKTESAPPPKS